MKSRTSLSIALLISLCCAVAVGQDAGWPVSEAPAAGPTQPPASAGLESPEFKASARAVLARQGLSRKERKALGLTIPQLAKQMLDLHREGELEDISTEELAIVLASRSKAANPEAFEGLSAPDWDRILAFLERLIPLLLMIFG